MFVIDFWSSVLDFAGNFLWTECDARSPYTENDFFKNFILFWLLLFLSAHSRPTYRVNKKEIQFTAEYNCIKCIICRENLWASCVNMLNMEPDKDLMVIFTFLIVQFFFTSITAWIYFRIFLKRNESFI